MAASVTLPDGRPRFVWTDTKTDPHTYASVILQSVAERARWRQQYENAKQASSVSTPSAAPPGTDGDPDG